MELDIIPEKDKELILTLGNNKTMWERKWISFDDVEISDVYQRILNPVWVREIHDHFDPGQARDLFVNDREGKLFVFDGQHTFKAAERLGFSGWWARIYSNLSLQEEAHLFNLFNSNTKKVSPYEVFRAEIAAGNDDYVLLDKTTRKYGIVIGSKRYEKPEDEGLTHSSAANRFLKMYKAGGPALVEDILKIATSAFPETKYSSAFLSNLQLLFINRSLDKLNTDRLISSLSAYDPKILDSKLKEKASTVASAKTVRVLIDIYNQGDNKRYQEIDSDDDNFLRFGRSEDSVLFNKDNYISIY